MLDWMFILFIILAIFFVILSITLPDREPYWKIVFIVLSTSLWFILSVSMLNIQIPYTNYNETTSQTEVLYESYFSENTFYIMTFFSLMGVLTMIYLIILIFDTYYSYKQQNEDEF